MWRLECCVDHGMLTFDVSRDLVGRWRFHGSRESLLVVTPGTNLWTVWLRVRLAAASSLGRFVAV